jgi:hypothetical protein
MPPQSLGTLIRITSFLAFLGEGYPYDTSWKLGRAENNTPNGARGRTPCMLPHHELGEAAGEISQGVSKVPVTNDTATDTSCRLGLRLTDHFARGYPAWRYVGFANNSWADEQRRAYFPYGSYGHTEWGRDDLT